MSGLRLLVVGAGMYVTGRGTDGPGTVLPALAAASRALPIDGVTVCGTRPEGRDAVLAAAARVNALLGTALAVDYAVAGEVLGGGAAGHDAAIVSIPDHLHHDATAALLEQGLHCLVVKPLVPTLAEARALCALRERRGLHGAVEFHKRWDEQNLVVRRQVQLGALGRLSAFQVEYSQRQSVPLETFRAWSARTNIFQYLGVHYVDLLYFLTGYRPLRAMACGTRGVLHERGLDTWDSVHALVEWRHPGRDELRLLGQFAIGWIDPERSAAFSDQRFVLVGSRGRVACDQTRRGLEICGEAGLAAVNPYFSQPLATMDGPEYAGYGPRSITTFVEDVIALRAGRCRVQDLARCRPTFEDALVSTAVVDAVNQSLAGDFAWRTVADA